MNVELPALLLCVILIVGSILLVSVLKSATWIKVTTIGILLVHVATAITNYTAAWLVAPDAGTYHNQAVDLMEGYNPRLFVAGKEAWPKLLSWLYEISSPTPLIPLVLNASLCALMIPLVHRIAETCRPGAGRSAVIFLILMPGWWLWGVVGLREPAVWILSLIALSFLADAIRTERLAPMVGFALAIVMFAWLRGPLALILAAGGGAAYIVAKRPTIQRFAILAIGMTASAALVLGQLSRLSAFQEGATTAAQTELSGSRTGFGVGNPVLLAARIATGPWPWELPQVGYVVAPDMVYVWGALVLTLLGIRSLRVRAATYALPAIGILASLAVTSGNYGTMIRLRTQALIFLLPLIAAGWVAIRQSRAARQTAKRARRRASRTARIQQGAS